MKNLTKKDVCVKIETKEKCKRVLEILKDETVYSGVINNIRETGLNDDFEWLALGLTNSWSGFRPLPSDKTPVTLEQLAEILGVNQQFKVGDRVRCINGVESGYKGVGWQSNYEFTIGWIENTSSGICAFPNINSAGVYAPFLELVKGEVKVETVTISRVNLGRLYPIVCEGWQSYITSLLDNAGSFAVEVQVPLENLRQAYKEADNKQKAILIEVAPLPKVKSTVKLNRWMNIYGNGEGSVFNTKEEALAVKYSSHIITVELTGEYETEVEDPLMVNTDDIIF